MNMSPNEIYEAITTEVVIDEMHGTTTRSINAMKLAHFLHKHLDL